MSEDYPDANDPELLRQKLALETAPILWRELEKFHARGVVVQVASDLDMTEVGYQLIQDNKEEVKAWMDAGQLDSVANADAQDWHDNNREVWALVIAPWVLVQKDKPQ
ncbi:DUF2288 domain-containing protein [Marinospirillum perlucidum]|uniref:DUF2288 domain-containing protein n=1 Tax=Marinospirillum perlucidum TaxID=1982602 RepID=UPI000DF33C33|nr:DUF2288 domain-containing protein [Marinospirillum perlucidum]